ncbi:hypothetical protein AB1Y20_020556 [Prymnesium parvum]|uniref:Glycoside hydrolase family 5 domain-containing protein n=1 Tax=Prymnesium parvum TaxID=97485 RepID=A0AB34JV22_PRYPA
MHAWLLILLTTVAANASSRTPKHISSRRLNDANSVSGDAAAPTEGSSPPEPDAGLPLEFGTKFDGKLYANGEPFHIKGINWFGSESGPFPPGGMEFHDVSWYCAFLAQHKFNAIRILFNHKAVLDDVLVDAGWPNAYPVTRQGKNTYLQMFLAIAKIAAQHGLLVMMACHRLDASSWPGKGLWYDNELGITEDAVMRSWTKIGKELCPQWNVFAVDLQNEPHASSWGKGMGKENDWGRAAERLGNHVLDACSRWLVMVEGVGYTPGAPGQDATMGIWWGENLVGAKTQPVRLKEQYQSKLVYSPHTYGPSVYMQTYFNARNFPENMERIWNDHFAFVQRQTGQPVVVGEMGGFYQGKDKTWQDWAFEYMQEHGIGLFYFCLNPDSADTGGILSSDWTTPNAEKLNALSKMPSTYPSQGARPPSAPLCSPPGIDRFGPVNQGECCESTCVEPRPESDPAYAKYKLVSMCRSACAPIMAPPALPQGWGCTLGRQHVSKLGEVYKTCSQPKITTEQECNQVYMLTPAGEPRPCAWADDKCIKGTCGQPPPPDPPYAPSPCPTSPPPPTPFAPFPSSPPAPDAPAITLSSVLSHSFLGDISRKGVLEAAAFSVACGACLLAYAGFTILKAGVGPNFKQRLQSTRVASEDNDTNEEALRKSKLIETREPIAAIDQVNEAEYDL